MSGWIKLHKSLRDWEWYDDHNTTRLLVHILLSVNYSDTKWRGIIIKKGSMVTSWQNLSKESGLSVRQCRTCIDKLIKCGELTREATSKYQVITLVKWRKLQQTEESNDNVIDKQTTNKRQTNDKQTTTIKEYNNNNNKYILHEQVKFTSDKFLEVWKEGRLHWDKLPTNISKLKSNEQILFNKLSQTYSEKEFREAINGLFFQGTLPAVRVRPTWFLENFESMRDCWLNQSKIYENKKSKS